MNRREFAVGTGLAAFMSALSPASLASANQHLRWAPYENTLAIDMLAGVGKDADDAISPTELAEIRATGLSAINVTIGSWTTADLNVSYDFDDRTQSPLLDGTRVAIGVSNITDREPPRVISPLFAVGFDAFNADAMGRFISARLTKRW